MKNGGGPERPTPGPGRNQRRWTILIIDPDHEAGRSLANALAPNVTAVVGSARAALDAMRFRMPDLIVTELDLPDASGIEFIARIHGTPATRHVLLLVATRRTAVRDKVAAFQAGADDYLVKPLNPQQFVDHVQLVSRFIQVIGRE
ncbi:MAG TPA: response regulator [Ktedonobacterales bacterium]|nr:response regulator [Ktedonobacterales bacterium]